MNHSLILYLNGEELFTSDLHWLYPLFELEEFLEKNNFPVADLQLTDKIAGRAAASLIVRIGIRKCHIQLISDRAIAVFEKHGVQYSFDERVDHIQCRSEDFITEEMSVDEAWLFLRKRAGRIQGVPLEIENLSVEIGQKRVLDDLSLSLSGGEQVVLAGENGAGKTTLIKTILGLIKPLTGTIQINKLDISSTVWKNNNHIVGYLPQELHLSSFPVSAGEVVSIGLSGQSYPTREIEFRVELAMRRTNCFHLFDMPYFSLSGGEKQRVSIARCLCQNAKLILMDEPTAALDDKGRDDLLQLLKELSVKEVPTMLIVSHDAGWIGQLGWKRMHLKNGKICWNS